MNDPKQSDKDLRSIQIEFEEVKPASCENTTNSGTSFFDISRIKFLPLVDADTIKSSSSKNPIIQDRGPTAEAILNMEVHYDEIFSEPGQDELQALIAEIKEMDFLPFVVDEMISSDIKLIEEQIQSELRSSQKIDGYSLSDFEISFEKSDPDQIPEDVQKVAFNLEDEPIVDVQNLKVEDVMSWLMADNQLRKIELNYDTVPYSPDTPDFKELIPGPVYYDEHEAYMMGLLDDFEELGDHREIPILEELLSEESQGFIVDRIAGIISKFRHLTSGVNKNGTTVEDEVELPVFSVFADLFKTIDTEAKLILLDEIIHVGDEKEIEFLDGLLDDSDNELRTKAQVVLKLLIAKLSHENPEAIYTKGVSAIVAGQIDNTSKTSEKECVSLLSETDPSPSSESEMFDIRFELCEVVDKAYDQNILNIPVVVTEVAPNNNGDSFFGQLRNFTKLFF